MSALPAPTRNEQDPAPKTPASSYIDVEVTPGGLNLFERQGDGKTDALVRALARYGLHLSPRVSSPCG